MLSIYIIYKLIVPNNT
ncbi:hypothetical protein [Escherichia coli]